MSGENRAFGVGPVKMQLVDFVLDAESTTGTVQADNLKEISHIIIPEVFHTAAPTYSGNTATLAFEELPSETSASALFNTTHVYANSEQGSSGNDYIIVFIDDAMADPFTISADGKTITLNITGVTDTNSWQTYLDNTGLSFVDVPGQVGAAPSTPGVYFEYDGNPVVTAATNLSGGLDGGAFGTAICVGK